MGAGFPPRSLSILRPSALKDSADNFRSASVRLPDCIKEDLNFCSYKLLVVMPYGAFA